MNTERERNDQARREMMEAIRLHLAASAPFDAAHKEHRARQAGAEKSSPTAVVSNERVESLVEGFRQALEAVAGHCVVVRDVGGAAEALRQMLEEKGARRVAVTNSPLVRQVLGRVTTKAKLLENPTIEELFDCDLGLTGAQAAVAETGTLILESDEERHRLASLVVPVHVAIITAGQIRRILAEVLESLSGKGREGLSRTVTFITGPSRTSDIELNLAIGVHGPGELHVIVLEGVDQD